MNIADIEKLKKIKTQIINDIKDYELQYSKFSGYAVQPFIDKLKVTPTLENLKKLTLDEQKIILLSLENVWNSSSDRNIMTNIVVEHFSPEIYYDYFETLDEINLKKNFLNTIVEKLDIFSEEENEYSKDFFKYKKNHILLKYFNSLDFTKNQTTLDLIKLVKFSIKNDHKNVLNSLIKNNNFNFLKLVFATTILSPLIILPMVIAPNKTSKFMNFFSNKIENKNDLQIKITSILLLMNKFSKYDYLSLAKKELEQKEKNNINNSVDLDKNRQTITSILNNETLIDRLKDLQKKLSFSQKTQENLHNLISLIEKNNEKINISNINKINLFIEDMEKLNINKELFENINEDFSKIVNNLIIYINEDISKDQEQDLTKAKITMKKYL